MPGKSNKSLATSNEGEDGLIFAWSRKRRGLFWLWGFFVLSLLLHAAGFYLFQVVYPSSGRLEPFPAQVMILDEKNPAYALLLQELNDRLVFLQPASTGSEGRRSMDDFAVAFRPSYFKRLPPFQEPLAAGRSPGTSKEDESSAYLGILPPFRVEDHVLPSLPDSGLVARAPEDKPAIHRRWALQGELARRAMPLSQAESLDRALPSVGEGPEVVLVVVVDATGAVKSISVKSGEEHPAINDFVEAVKKQLKFAPLPGSDPVEGELTVGK